MWHQLIFSNSRYELGYVEYVGQLRAPATRCRLLLSCCASLVALAKLLLLLSAEYSLRWRALSVAVLMAALTASFIAATAAAFLKPSWFAARHEQASVLLEVGCVFVTFWWLSIMRPRELLQQQTPFTAFVSRGYLLLFDQVRLASCLPLLLFEACAFLWLQLSTQQQLLLPAAAVAGQYLLLGQCLPLAAVLFTETQHRWRYVQHKQLQLGTLGPWAGIIDAYSLTSSAAQQLLRGLKRRWLLSGAVYGAGAAVLVGLASLLVAHFSR